MWLGGGATVRVSRGPRGHTTRVPAPFPKQGGGGARRGFFGGLAGVGELLFGVVGVTQLYAPM